MTDPDDAARRTVTLRFAAQPEHLVLARLVLTGIAVAEGLSSQVVSDLKLAVTEACTNAIEHAYAGTAGANGREHGVTVSYTLEPGTLTIEVADRGAGFDPVAVRAEKPAPEPGARDGGMGLSIIESLVDELAIVADSSGSRVTFVKRYEPQARA